MSGKKSGFRDDGRHRYADEEDEGSTVRFQRILKKHHEERGDQLRDRQKDSKPQRVGTKFDKD